MSIQDRDYYQEELAKRLRQIEGPQSNIPSPSPFPPLQLLPPRATKLKQFTKRPELWSAVAMVAIVLAATPLILAPRCDQGALLSEPIACWQYSWQALSTTTWWSYAGAVVAMIGMTAAVIGMATAINALITRHQFGRFRPFLGSKKRPPIPSETRRAVMMRARRRCEDCGATGRLDMHHVSYRRLGREQGVDLLALCRACHYSAIATRLVPTGPTPRRWHTIGASGRPRRSGGSQIATRRRGKARRQV